ncbi:MAG: hypothetical protein ABWY82_15000 [Tardiphaga sp.]|jgi:hypothetical protein
MEEDPMRLRVTAVTCRRLLDGVLDPLTVAHLESLAEECEAKLSKMADGFDDTAK